MKKRFLASILSMALIISFAAVPVFADNTVDESPESSLSFTPVVEETEPEQIDETSDEEPKEEETEPEQTEEAPVEEPKEEVIEPEQTEETPVEEPKEEVIEPEQTEEAPAEENKEEETEPEQTEETPVEESNEEAAEPEQTEETPAEESNEEVAEPEQVKETPAEEKINQQATATDLNIDSDFITSVSVTPVSGVDSIPAQILPCISEANLFNVSIEYEDGYVSEFRALDIQDEMGTYVDVKFEDSYLPDGDIERCYTFSFFNDFAFDDGRELVSIEYGLTFKNEIDLTIPMPESVESEFVDGKNWLLVTCMFDYSAMYSVDFDNSGYIMAIASDDSYKVFPAIDAFDLYANTEYAIMIIAPLSEFDLSDFVSSEREVLPDCENLVEEVQVIEPEVSDSSKKSDNEDDSETHIDGDGNPPERATDTDLSLDSADFSVIDYGEDMN